MARKSFTSTKRTDFLEFDINGTPYQAKASAPVGILMNFSEKLGSIDMDDEQAEKDPAAAAKAGIESIRALKDFFRAVLASNEDADRFFAQLEDPDQDVDLELLMEIAEWLGKEYTARPTGQTSSDTSPGTGSGSDSTAGAQLAPSTFSRPEESERGQLVPST